MWHVWESAEVSYIQGLAGRPEGKRPLGGPWRRWDVTIKNGFSRSGMGRQRVD